MALALVAVPSFTRAQAADTTALVPIEGHVVALESDDVVVDLAGLRGAANGDLVELWRPLELKHPVTGKTVTDRFRIGALKLTQVRDALALARPSGKLARPPAAGDIVILRVARPLKREKHEPARPAVPDAPAAKPTAVRRMEPSPGPAPAADPEARAVSAMFDALRGADVTRRIIAYESYVRREPKGRFAVVLWEEAAHLRRLLGSQDPRLRNANGPGEALAGIPIQIAVELDGPATGAVLHARRAGEVSFRSTAMSGAGEGYFSASIPAERMQAPVVEYFVEAVTVDGERADVLGAPDRPERIEVHPIPSPTPPVRNDATASVWTDYADYNRMKGNDVVWQTEGYVGTRFEDEGLRALRSGFGVFRGVGGSLEELDEQQKSARRVGLTYGYLEVEAGFSSFTGLIVRGVIGLRDDGVGGGAQGLLRLGSDRKTNLQIGGEVLGGIGLRGIAQLELGTFPQVPILLRTEVTNQPAGSAATPGDVRPARPGALPQDTSLNRGEVGARAIVQVGYRVLPSLVLAARGSYQGRNIKHAGPGFGGAVTYSW